MASDLKAKLGTPTAMTVTLASLASSTTGVGRQADMVDNTTNLFNLIHVVGKLKTGTTSFAAGNLFIYLIKADDTIATDNAGASDAALTVATARLVKTVSLAEAATTYYFDFKILDPGYKWTLAFVHNTVATLDSTAGNHAIRYTGEYAQAT